MYPIEFACCGEALIPKMDTTKGAKNTKLVVMGFFIAQ
jgi:hypothetical protein